MARKLGDLKNGDMFVFAEEDIGNKWKSQWDSDGRGGMFNHRPVLTDGPDFDYLYGYYLGRIRAVAIPKLYTEQFALGLSDGIGDRLNR